MMNGHTKFVGGRASGLASALLTSALALAVLSANAAAALSAADVVAKNAAARGGLEAWKKIQTMAWVGRVEGAGLPPSGLPFLLDQKRPRSTRFEVIVQNQKAIRAYDGTQGWKLKPGGGGAPDLQDYAPDELAFARDAQVIDGPLMDDVASGGKISFGGVDAVDGRSTYLINIALPTGTRHRIWVDAETFLEVKYERELRDEQGHSRVTAVIFRDYHDFEGLKMPVEIMSEVSAGGEQRRMFIERVALNPPLDERAFARPNLATRRHHGVTVDASSPSADSATPTTGQP